MGDDGTMAKGTRHTPEFKAKAVRLSTESRGSYSSETKAIEQAAKDLGGRAGDAAPLAQQDGRHGRGGGQAVGRRRDGGVEELRAGVARLRRANEILTTASAFFAARLDPTRR